MEGAGNGGVLGSSSQREKLIIDADPGIGDSMVIMMAFQTPELEIKGLTTVFGNATIENATRNALLLGELVGRPDVPVAKGSPGPLKGGKPQVWDLVHGSDGLGNISLSDPKTEISDRSAVEFLVDTISAHPGEVTVLALGPLTNLALAIKRDSTFARKTKKIVILGGALFTEGNANPAAEANMYADPEAADIVFTSAGADIVVVGLNVTSQVVLTDADLDQLRRSEGRHAQVLCDMCRFYVDYHVMNEGMLIRHLVSLAAVIRPDLFTYRKGAVRVETQGIGAGDTLMDLGLKRWNGSNPWTGCSPVSVAWTVKVDEVVGYTKSLLTRP